MLSNVWRRTRWLLVPFILLSILIWFAPIRGRVGYLTTDPVTFPQVVFTETEQDTLLVTVLDAVPHTYVRLEADGVGIDLRDFGDQTAAGAHIWRWEIAPTTQKLALYHSCESGCQAWHSLNLQPQPAAELQTFAPTKLGVVFANPDRDWHNRQAWDIEITYAQQVDDEYWGVDALAQRVQAATSMGLRVLIRVEYDQGQTLPARDDFGALEQYLAYVRRLSRDVRLQSATGLIIGSNFNTLGANSQFPEQLITPEWAARVFNGYGADLERHDNVIAVMRAENSQLLAVVGPVNPFNTDQNGTLSYTIDEAWLNYMNTLVARLDEQARLLVENGIADGAPDGFAVQAFGRLPLATTPADEPQQNLTLPSGAQVGFRIWEDWLAIINQYPTTAHKPVYINATNTFDPTTGTLPADNYPRGWLTNALTAVNNEPQIAALCWFIDDFPHDDQWELFSLSGEIGRMLEANAEFSTLLQTP